MGREPSWSRSTAGPPRGRWLACGGLVAVFVLVLVGGGILASRSTTVTTAARAAWRRIAPPAQAPQVGPPPAMVELSIDPRRELRPISPLIYGLAHASPAEVTATGATIQRWGGNPNTRYNWEPGNAWNAARDYEFRNYGADEGKPAGPSATSDEFVAANTARHLPTILTVPAMGWVANSGNRALASVGVPALGGPPLPGDTSGAIAGYDPTRNRQVTSVASRARKGAPFTDPPDLTDGVVYQDEWIAHLVRRFGSAATGGVAYYAFDNEPDLWSYTHTDVHPVDVDYQTMRDAFIEYAEAIKNVDPTAKILGPTVSGWTPLFYSARDRGTDTYRTHADRRAHDDMPFVPWWLAQIRAHDQQTGQRTLDVLDVHMYPQGNGVFGGASDPATNRLRVRSTRMLWDPSYIDESWINDTVQLIPRLRGWIDQYYPGTGLAIGEWNWGADKTMNGAVAIANVLGIFGREGVDIAAYWTSPPADSPGAQAFALYTNYDGSGSGFGDVALPATSSAPDDVQVYASRTSDNGDVLLMLINARPESAIPTSIRVAGAGQTVSDTYRLDARVPGIQDLGAAEINAGQFRVDLPAESITLMRISAP